MAGITIGDLTAMFGVEIDKSSWDGARATIGQTEEALKELVKQFVKTGKVKLPPLTDAQEAAKILERRAKSARVAALLPAAPAKAPLSDTEEAMKVVEARLKKGRIDALVATTDINKAVSTIGLPGAPGMKGKVGEKVQEGSEGMLSKLGEIRLATLAVGYAVIQTSRRLIGMGEASIESASKIHDTAISTGISTDALQEMKFAAEQSGSSLEALVAGAKRLNLAVAQAATHGSGPAAKGLKELGLSAKGVQKVIKEGGLDAGITLVSEKLSQIKDPAERSRIAIALLGKAGQSLLPTLTDLSSLREDARDLGGIIPESDINAMEDFGDQMGRVKFAVGGLFNQLVAALIPALKEITDGILKWMTANKEVIKTNLQGVVEGLVSGIHALIAVTGAIADVIAIFVDESDVAVTALEILTVIMAIFGVTAMVAWIAATWPILLIIAAIALLIIAIKKIIDHWGGIKDAFSRAWAAIMSGLSSLWKAIVDGLSSAWEFVKGIGTAIKNFFVETIPNAIKAAWNAVWDAIIAGAEKAWNTVKKMSIIGIAIDAFQSTKANIAAGATDSGVMTEFGMQPFASSDAGMSVSPSAVGGGGSSVQIDNINVTSPNADPKQVAAAIKPAMREFMDDELQKAKK